MNHLLTSTTTNGPVVVSEKTLRALISIRREKLLPALYGRVSIVKANFEAMSDVLSQDNDWDWLHVEEDRPEVVLPDRVSAANASDAATLRLAIGLGASLVLLENPVREKAKLSFIKSEGTVSILVLAHRHGILSAVQPMVKALEKLGHGDLLPPPEQLEALWTALDDLRP